MTDKPLSPTFRDLQWFFTSLCGGTGDIPDYSFGLSYDNGEPWDYRPLLLFCGFVLSLVTMIGVFLNQQRKAAKAEFIRARDALAAAEAKYIRLYGNDEEPMRVIERR